VDSIAKLGRPPNPQLKQQREGEILTAAALLFAEKGFADADLQELAQRLGVGKGTLYRYFPTKQELFLATVRNEVQRLTTTLETMVPRDARPIEQMSLVIEAYLRFFQTNPQVVELMVLERSHFKHRGSTYFDLQGDESCARWDGLVEVLVGLGILRELPFEQIRNVVGDLVYGTMFSNYMSGRPADPAQQAREIMDVIYLGLLTPMGQSEWRSLNSVPTTEADALSEENWIANSETNSETSID
jgi:AcrR family transcriptional regulator